MGRNLSHWYPSVKTLSVAIWFGGTTEFSLMIPRCGQLASYQIDLLEELDTERLALLWTLTRIGQDLGSENRELIKKIKRSDIYSDDALIRWARFYGISRSNTTRNREELLDNLNGDILDDIDRFLNEVRRRRYKDGENPNIIE